MNFYISKIRLWFRRESEPRTLEFYQDKVNVITGDSSTGKSSILKIIDYCLLEDRSTIVQDVINENIAWYGLVFGVENVLYTIIRKAPTLEQAEMCVIFREGEYLPKEPVANMDDVRPKVMVKMNDLFNISSKIKLESKVKLNFRHNLIFNYLTEDIIATENTYQDLRFFRSHEFSLILDDLFKMAIGVNESKMRELESELKSIQSKVEKKQKGLSKEIEIIEKYNQTRQDIIQELANLGFCDSTDIEGNPEEWIRIMNSTIEAYNIQFRDTQSNEKRKHLEVRLNELRDSYGYFTSLQAEYERYMKRLEKQNDSLIPLDYMRKHMSEVFRYYETSLLLNKLDKAWTSIKTSYNPEVKLPQDFLKRMHELEQEIRTKTVEYEKLNPLQPQAHDIIWMRSVILLAERIEKDLSKVPTITIKEEDILEVQQTATSIEEQLIRLRARNNNAIADLNERINKYFRYQDGLSESYNDCKPVYSMAEHTLMLEREETEYAIANVGSKSNYMFLHLCYFFGLHELLAYNKNKQIPQFLFIDQPSIPYYADRKDDANQAKLNDDREKLRAAFKLTDKFMEEMTRNGHFQIIMVEHAGPDYWEGVNKLESFKTRYQFTHDNGLIPDYILK